MLNTVVTETILGVISESEYLELYERNEIDKRNVVLISIKDPDNVPHALEKVSGFQDVLQISFWDLETPVGTNYKIITDEQGKEIQEFIVNCLKKNPKSEFLVHCHAGISRSAGVAKAIECIKYFGVGEEAKYNYKTSFSSDIDAHFRYSPNLVVFDKIVK